MPELRGLASFGIGNTPTLPAANFCPQGRLFVKLESANYANSVKARTAWFLLDALLASGRASAGSTLVESTSGNLGVALTGLAGTVGISTVCIVDPTVSAAKVNLLRKAGAEVGVAELDERNSNYPSARIALVRRLIEERGWIWPNQYAAVAGMRAHEETTGPEIWAAVGRIDYFVAAVGTGGTICGVGRFLKSVAPSVRIVGVEPAGSTIFGGTQRPFISAGAGLAGPSEIVSNFGDVIDSFAKVPDDLALACCRAFARLESYSIGITGGAAMLVAGQIARTRPKAVVVAMAADGAENYRDVLRTVRDELPEASINLCPYSHARHGLVA